MTHGTRRSALAAVFLALTVWPAGAAEEKKGLQFETIVQAQIAADQDAAASQKRINDLDDKTREMLQKYNLLVAEAESMTNYSNQLQLQVKDQNDAIASYNKQLVDIENTAREVMPMMQRMLDQIDRFVELDMPFLHENRRERIQKLKDVMGKADVAISEKYRRIVEAYQIEMDFGRTLEAYDGKLEGDPAGRTVKFLRVGRVALCYQTLDGTETGYWDRDKKAWVVDNGYRAAVKQGFAVATKQGAPELIQVPISTPQDAAPAAAPSAAPAAMNTAPAAAETQS
ncbi:MAG TPA: DUF3450 domain-containing protein [Myxococcota bacterium]|nr:DUF3450 domain-containing protein [Myxococcota bacterium]